MFPAEKLRRRNSPSGSIGSLARASYARKAPSSTIPPISGMNTAGLDHPSRGCSISANTDPPSPAAHSSAPGRSTRRPPGSRGAALGTATRISTTQAAARGMLIRKISRQEPIGSSSPPTSGPSTPAIAPHAVQLPIAPPRSDSGNVFTITASELGTSSAPAMPCTIRATTSTPIDGAIAHASDATPKPATPIANTRRSPYRSPSEPPTRISEPSVSR